MQAVKKFRTHPGTQGSLPCSQEPATCPYPKPQQYVPHPPILFHCSSWSFPSGFLHHNLLLHTCYMSCPSHPSRFDNQDSICEQCKPQGFSVCSLLHSPSSVPILPLNTLCPNTSAFRSSTVRGKTSSVLCNVHVLRQTAKTRDAGPDCSCIPCRRSDINCFTD